MLKVRKHHLKGWDKKASIMMKLRNKARRNKSEEE